MKAPFATAAGVALTLLLTVQTVHTAPVAASELHASQWHSYRTPSHEDLLILPGSDIDSFTIAGPSGNTIFAIGTWNSTDSCVENSFTDDNIAAGQTPRLWKSSDAGTTWKDRTDCVLHATNLPDCNDDSILWNDFVFFSAVTAAPDSDDIVVVTGYDALRQPVVVYSDDGADNFRVTGCGGLAGEILCAAVSPEVEDSRSVAIGTLDLSAGGSVWRFEADSPWTTRWEDTGEYGGWEDYWLGSGGFGTRRDVYAVTSIAFSPSYQDDHAIVALLLAHAEEPDDDPYTGYHVAMGAWDNDVWNQTAGFDGYPVLVTTDNNAIHADTAAPSFFLRHFSDISLPDDFHADSASTRVFMLAVNGIEMDPTSDEKADEGGFLFWMDDSSLSRDLLQSQHNPWLASMCYNGHCDRGGIAIFGGFFADDIATSWRWSPEIQDWFYDDGDHSDGENVLPCCSGVLVMWSESMEECCPEWRIAAQPPSGQFNAQVAFAPDGSRAFASTSGDSRHGLDAYRFADESSFSLSTEIPTGDRWAQTGLIDTMIDDIEDLNYGVETECLYLHTSHLDSDDQVCACESVWLSCNAGTSYSRVLYGRPDDDEGQEHAFEDVMDKYHRGFLEPWTEGFLQSAGVRYIIGDAIDADDEEQVEEGFNADTVYRFFENEGGEWEPISELSLNYEHLLVTECHDTQGSILYVGFDNLWWDYTSNVPMPYQSDGSDPVCPHGHECRKVSGVARCMNPDARTCCTNLQWDYLIRGLKGTANAGEPYERLLFSATHCGESATRLWAIDDGNRYWSEVGEQSDNYDWCTRGFINPDWGRLWSYDDCCALTEPGVTTPDNAVMIPSDPCFCTNEEFTLEWDRPCDGCEYEIEVALDEGFRNVVLDTTDFTDTPSAGTCRRFYHPTHPCTPSLVVPQGMLECSHAYWWRVRAHMAETDEVISTWWSTPVSFRIAPAAAEAIVLGAPGDGVTRIPTTDIAFTWNRVNGATSYDFMLVDSERSHVASQVGDFTSFVLPGPLACNTPYVWRVLALDGNRVISKSVEATFQTAPGPSVPATAPPMPTVIPPQTPGTPDWAPFFIGAVGILLIATLAALSYVNRLQRRAARDSSRHTRAP
ncbi:MAG: hypothetical protein JW846_06895 [Dehalococcoidia bacterium]|nr:hypothetical protein [Dehalococcoidia bacterium]